MPLILPSPGGLAKASPRSGARRTPVTVSDCAIPISRERADLTPACRSRLSQGPNVLFCYGTLQFDAVLKALLGRIPERAPTSAPGYRAAALSGRVYPGIVARAFDGSAPGVLLTDFSDKEWEILDAFEDERYELREVTLSSGVRRWAYVWQGEEVREDDWDAEDFLARHLTEYAAHCARLAPGLAAGLPKGE